MKNAERFEGRESYSEHVEEEILCFGVDTDKLSLTPSPLISNACYFRSWYHHLMIIWYTLAESLHNSSDTSVTIKLPSSVNG